MNAVAVLDDVDEATRTAARPCRRCSCDAVPAAVWNAQTLDERARARAAGMRRAGGRGLCAACYQYLSKRDDIERFARARRGPVPETSWTTCRRCGHPETVGGVLCVDCLEVTYDLNERDLWEATP